ncbi:beta-L-arabinofuranosidase domain-containing protein [Thermogutta sp.]|uniref:beta-L-arabinofuranosidase domain-containing protein n=1 Tax=Thermogutta sp. TaxID=1962930 RepID=UPI00321F6432
MDPFKSGNLEPRRTVCIFTCGVLWLVAVTVASGETPWRQVPLQDVQIKGEMGRRIDVTIENNILQIDISRDFLAPFQRRNQKEGYVGLGKLLDSIVRLAVHTGDPRLRELKDTIIREILATQEEDGYIGIMEPSSRMWSLWDIHEMSYLVYALATDHRFFGGKDSLEAARRLADYMMRNWEAHPDNQPGRGSITVYLAVLGLENAFLLLSEEAHDPRYREFVVNFRKLPEWQARVVVGRHGQIEGHIYAYLCRSIAQLRLSDEHDDPRLWQASRQALDFLLHREGLVITGECGDHECWHDSQSGTINLGETCATAYLIRWLDELLRREKKSLYGDIMERVIYNGLFAAQSPDGRRIRYYTPFDGPRSYFPSDTYCCPNNYRRIIAELPGMVGYRTEHGIAVNLYTEGQFKLPLPSGQVVTIAQRTDYPHNGMIALTINLPKPEMFELRLRIPRFCEEASVKLPQEDEAVTVKGGDWAVFNRTWQNGDTVMLRIPMKLRLVRGRRAQSGRVAVMYGPLVFCLSRQGHADLKDIDLRLITINPETLEGPFPDETVHPGGVACRVKAWAPGAWYPQAPTSYTLELTEFADPTGEATYFHVPNPYDPAFVEDELIGPPKDESP